jgi:hypothetical protein
MECKDEFTTSSHIFTAIAASCFAWLIVAKPAITLSGSGKYSKYSLIILVHLVLALILPAVFLGEKLYDERSESVFIIIKIVALMVGALIREGIIIGLDATSARSKNNGVNYSTILTIVIILLLVANIAEAVYTQIKNISPSSGPNEVDHIDLINSIMGIILIIILFMNLGNNYKGIGYLNDGNTLRMVTNLGSMFILAYTFWNMVFVVEIGGIPVFMFFCVTLLLPIIVSMLGIADWLQTRALTLLFFMVLTLGMGRGQSNILPMYNTIDESHSAVLVDDELSKVQYNYYMKIFLLIMSCIFTLLAFVDISGAFINGGKLLISSKINDLIY